VGDLVGVVPEPGGAGLLESSREHMAVSALNHAGANQQAQSASTWLSVKFAVRLFNVSSVPGWM